MLVIPSERFLNVMKRDTKDISIATNLLESRYLCGNIVKVIWKA